MASGAGIALCTRSRVEAIRSGRVVSISTDDVDEFNQYSGGWSVEYRALGATAFRTTVFLAMTPSLQVALVQHAMGYSSQGQNPAGTISIAVPVDGAPPMVHRGRGIGPSQMALISSGEGYECVARSGARFFVVSLPQEKVERYAADLRHEPNLFAHAPDQLRFADSAHRSRYLDTCRQILGAVGEHPGVFSDPRAAALLEEKFLESLLLSAHVVPSCAHGRARYALARQAYRYLQDRAD